MNDQPQNEEGLDIETQYEETVEKKGFLQGSGRFFVFAGAVVTVIGGSIYYALQQSGPDAPSAVVTPPRMDMTPGGDVQAGSEVFQEAITRDNVERAELAERVGQSFIPTPEAIPEPINIDEGRIAPGSGAGAQQVRPEDRIQQVTPGSVQISAPSAQQQQREQTVAPDTTRTRVPVAQSRQPQVATSNQGVDPSAPEEENPFTQRIVQQANQMRQANAQSIESTTEIYNDSAAGGLDGDGVMLSEGIFIPDGTEGQNGQGANGEDGEDIVIRAGDILYAEMINSVSSDANTVVVAEVTVGEFRGARILGNFAVDEAFDYLVVQFDRMILEDGTTRDITGLAVDGRTAEAYVRTDINRRLLRRYGPLIAAAFVQGAGEVASQRATEQTIVGDNVVTTSPRATAREAIAGGVSTAAGAIAGDIEASRVTTPRINLRRGHPLAVLFIENVPG